MAIVEQGVEVHSVGELLGWDLRIPSYQRPYSWQPSTALQLLEDLWDAYLDSRTAAQKAKGHSGYLLGTVILQGDATSAERQIVDGQQRTITLSLICSLLEGRELPGLDEDGFEGHHNSTSSLVAVHRNLRSRVKSIELAERPGFVRFVREECVVVKIETDDADEAFRFFDSQNYRGKPLNPHDLLKAYHLRAIPEESESSLAAIVEAWERANDDDQLERLFSRFLYRIARWSRGQYASREFTNQDLDLFKGLSVEDRSPSSMYHRGAQAALPAFAQLPGQDGDVRSEHLLARSRHQLDLPVVAGRPFFEFVSYMLREVQGVQRLLDDREMGWGRFARDYRYRYVSELFLAAVLYHSNRFLDVDLADESASPFDDVRFREVWDRYFRWAFNLRLELQRVQWRSVSNWANQSLQGMLPGAGMFQSIREWSTGRELKFVVLPDISAPEGRDQYLVELLREVS